MGATLPLVRFPNCHECHYSSKCHLNWVGEPDYIATCFCELHTVCRTIFWNPGILEQLFRDPECWCHIAISPAFYPDESFCFVPGSCSLLKTASTKVTWILPRNKKWNPSCYSTGNLVNQEWSRSYSEYIQGLNGGGCSEDSIWFVLPFDLTHFIRRDTLFKRLHLRATQIATLNFWSQEENQIIGPLEGRKDGRYVSVLELWTADETSAWRTIWVKSGRQPVAV